jgi:hypothetical protein
MWSRLVEIVTRTKNYTLKTLKKRVFAMPLKPCFGGHGHWKLSEEPKIVRYNPRKWAANMKNMCLATPLKRCFGGHDH